jgi:hypothetical protein
MHLCITEYGIEGPGPMKRMRIRSLFVFVLLLSMAAVSAVGQTVTVKPRKVVYKRTAKNVPDHQRTFEVEYPVFSGKLTPSALSALKTGTDYWRIFDTSLAANLKTDHWLSSLGYEVKYNNHNILDILLYIEGVGAYPDGSSRALVFDLRSGRKLTYADLFTTSRLPELVSKIRSVMKQNEEEAIKENEEVRERLAYYREAYPEIHKLPAAIELKDLDGFSISDTGVTFLKRYGFAHVEQALEPSGEFFLSYKDLTPFIRTDGLLARFVR